VIDLHCHSTCSDGTDAPEALAAIAAEVGLRAVALTDHDTVAGFEPFAVACADRGVRPVRAAEISCLDEGVAMHVLCYFVSGDEASGLRALLASLGADRASRNEELLARLRALGYDRVTDEEVRKEVGPETRSIGRPHVADAILRLYPEEFPSRQAVFDGLLGRTGRAYVRKARVSVAEASAAARADGAVTALAHPLITLLPDEGLTGLECHYGRHDAHETELLVALARRHGLVPTGGSDYHGATKPDLSLGTGTGRLEVPDALLDELEAARP